MLTINVEAEFDLPLVNEAVDLLARAVAMSPDKPHYRHAYAEALLAARRNEEAEEQLRYLRQTERSARTAYLLAVALRRLGRGAEAHGLLDEAREEGTVGFAKLHILRGRLLESEGRIGDAANEYGEAMLLNPLSREARWRRARTLVALAQEREDGGALYRRAFHLLREHRPGANDEDEYHFLLGRIHLALLQPVEALKHLERSRHPAAMEKQLLVGLAFLLGGDAAGARANLATAAKDEETRPRIEAYLVEIATAPEETLASLAGGTGTAITARLAADLDTLVAIFGPAAPEIERVREAARQGRVPEAVRTRVESADLVVGGRLFAGPDERAASADTAARAATDPEATLVSGRRGDTTRPARVMGDSLFPQTEVDVTRSIPRTESMELAAQGPEDESSADEKTQRLSRDSFPDFDEVPDLDFGSLEDEDTPS